MIALKNVSKEFVSGARTVDAVKNVTLNIGDGEVYGIIGFSGAGKSTLVRLINLLERPSAGQVIVDGTDMASLSPKALRATRKKIGMIFQQFNLSASRTVFQNVAYPLQHTKTPRAEIARRVESLLTLVGLADESAAYPSQLSGGQKQRVALARALACDPKILLCDEATSALDPQTTLSILKLLKRLNRDTGITIVVITHEMQVVKEICDRVAVMEKGRVVEEGDVFSVFADPHEAITRSFIDTTSNLSKIYSLIAENAAITQIPAGACIVRLNYRRRNVAEALVSVVSRKFRVDVNIIFGNIELIGENPLGGLIVILSGEQSDIDGALEYFAQNNVRTEVIKDARIA